MKSNKILFITSNQKVPFTFARNEKHSQYEFKQPYNITQATHLFQHNNPPQNQSQTQHHASHLLAPTQHTTKKPISNITSIECLQVLKWNKILFITSNQQYSFTFVRNEKHSKYYFKSSYNTQATRLLQYMLQYNIPSQIQFLTSHVNQQYPITIQKNEKHSQY